MSVTGTAREGRQSGGADALQHPAATEIGGGHQLPFSRLLRHCPALLWCSDLASFWGEALTVKAAEARQQPVTRDRPAADSRSQGIKEITAGSTITRAIATVSAV
jgi:hypothetical protein